MIPRLPLRKPGTPLWMCGLAAPPLKLRDPLCLLTGRVMKLIIEEKGYNAWLASGTPHCNIRRDYIDTPTGIRRKVIVDVDSITAAATNN